MYLLSTPNDRRTWVYPTHNRVSDTFEDGAIELAEDPSGDVHIEFWKAKFLGQIVEPTKIRISSPTLKAASSADVKTYRVR